MVVTASRPHSAWPRELSVGPPCLLLRLPPGELSEGSVPWTISAWVAAQRHPLGATGRLPDPKCAVPAGRDDEAAVGADGTGTDPACVTAQRRPLGATGRLPDPKGAVPAGQTMKLPSGLMAHASTPPV